MSFLDPADIVAKFGLKEGMQVADFGSGAGHFVSVIAPLVGRSGTVYAVDVRPEALEVTRSNARLQGLLQIRPQRGDLEQPSGSGLNEASLDAVLCSNLLHQVDDVAAVLTEARRVLKPTGKLAIVEWEAGVALAPPDAIGSDRMQELVTKAGFVLERHIEAGEFHYAMLFALAQ